MIYTPGRNFDLVYRLKRNEHRGQQAEMIIQWLNIRIDQVEADVIGEKSEIKKIGDDLNKVLDYMINIKSLVDFSY